MEGGRYIFSLSSSLVNRLERMATLVTASTMLTCEVSLLQKCSQTASGSTTVLGPLNRRGHGDGRVVTGLTKEMSVISRPHLSHVVFLFVREWQYGVATRSSGDDLVNRSEGGDNEARDEDAQEDDQTIGYAHVEDSRERGQDTAGRFSYQRIVTWGGIRGGSQSQGMKGKGRAREGGRRGDMSREKRQTQAPCVPQRPSLS